MAKGANAKNVVTNKIAMAFGSDFIGEVDKKIYVWADDGGEKVQIAIALTCPKVNVDAPAPGEAASAPNSGWDFSDTPIVSAAPVQKAEVTEEEKKNIADMMARLGL